MHAATQADPGLDRLFLNVGKPDRNPRSWNGVSGGRLHFLGDRLIGSRHDVHRPDLHTERYNWSQTAVAVVYVW